MATEEYNMTTELMRAKKILVICPAHVCTAGPEALHQLVATLNELGQAAAIVYHPFNKIAKTPVPYLSYHVPVARYQDEQGDLIIFPEIMPVDALKVKKAQAAIWWMSVNNYTCVRYVNRLRDKIRYIKNVVKGKRPLLGIRALKKLQHFAQSDYALTFLKQHGIDALMLSDPIPYYTEKSYLDQLGRTINASQRNNVVRYNPKKGQAVIKKLMAALPHIHFIPVQNLNRSQLAEAFLTAKVYVDFGHHPGKDRLPREAAVHGCCVITGRYGSAANAVDVPIPERYKLDVNVSNFVTQFDQMIQEIFNHFERCTTDFNEYRAIIAQEPEAFRRQVIVALL